MVSRTDPYYSKKHPVDNDARVCSGLSEENKGQYTLSSNNDPVGYMQNGKEYYVFAFLMGAIGHPVNWKLTMVISTEGKYGYM